MCGRYGVLQGADSVAEAFQAMVDPEVQWESNEDVRPTTSVLVVSARDGQRVLRRMRWGLVPSWARAAGEGPPMINARSETVAEKPAFRSAFKARRCLLPASHFDEWQLLGDGAKQRTRFALAAGGMLGFAGLWECWRKGEEALFSCTILTTTPCPEVAPVHDRMPVLLSPTAWARWLDPASDPASLRELLAPSPEGVLVSAPVGEPSRPKRSRAA